MPHACHLDEPTLRALIDHFYDHVRGDAELGPVFESAVADWPDHLARLTRFWSSVMLTSGLYKGNPVAAHLRHADEMTPQQFERWLEIWRASTAELLEPSLALAMQAKAERIAESLQLAVQYRRPIWA